MSMSHPASRVDRCRVCGGHEIRGLSVRSCESGDSESTKTRIRFQIVCDDCEEVIGTLSEEEAVQPLVVMARGDSQVVEKAPTWGVVEVQHGGATDAPCKACLDLASTAAAQAQAMATHTASYEEGQHGVTIRRFLQTLIA